MGLSGHPRISLRLGSPPQQIGAPVDHFGLEAVTDALDTSHISRHDRYHELCHQTVAKTMT